MVQKMILTETETSIILEIPRALLKRAASAVPKKINSSGPFKTIARSEKEFKAGRARLLNGSLLDLIKRESSKSTTPQASRKELRKFPQKI